MSTYITDEQLKNTFKNLNSDSSTLEEDSQNNRLTSLGNGFAPLRERLESLTEFKGFCQKMNKKGFRPVFQERSGVFAVHLHKAPIRTALARRGGTISWGTERSIYECD